MSHNALSRAPRQNPHETFHIKHSSTQSQDTTLFHHQIQHTRHTHGNPSPVHIDSPVTEFIHQRFTVKSQHSTTSLPIRTTHKSRHHSTMRQPALRFTIHHSTTTVNPSALKFQHQFSTPLPLVNLFTFSTHESISHTNTHQVFRHHTHKNTKAYPGISFSPSLHPIHPYLEHIPLIYSYLNVFLVFSSGLFVVFGLAS